MRKYLKDQYNIVVDRCNFDAQQRKTWVDIANEFKAPVDCIVFTANQEDCGQRIQERQNHPTGVHGKEGLHILKKFIRNYQPPTDPAAEGFDKLLLVEPSVNPECTEDRVDTVLALLEQSPSHLPPSSNDPAPTTHITL
ncbi:AAA domain-containing protein [Chlamydoabsidia padenii]|nr:AAA domain-containing protein [Chlamydoabsidia padenii]